MNLAFHQLRHEFRRSRLPLVLYALVLLANLAIALGWIGTPRLRTGGYWEQSVLPVLLLIAYWAAFGSVVVHCVIADSPANRGRFLASRPLPSSALATAKGLYVLIGAVLPAAVLEGLALALLGTDFPTALRAGLEQFVHGAIIAAGLACFAAHWKTVQGFLLASLVVFLSLMLLGPLLDYGLRTWFDTSLAKSQPTVLTLLQGVLAVTIGLTWTARFNSRHGRRLAVLVPAFALLLLGGLLVSTLTPLQSWNYRPFAQAALDQAVEDSPSGVEIVPAGFQVGGFDNRSELMASCSVAPRPTDLSDEFELRWDVRSYRWLVDGQSVQRDSFDRSSIARTYIQNDGSPISDALSKTITSHLGTEVIFRLGGMGQNWTTGTALTLPTLDYQPGGNLVGQPARIEARLQADAFRWEVMEDLPLEATDRTTTVRDPWRIAGVSHDGSRQLKIQLAERVLHLETAPGPEQRRSQYRWQNFYRFALYQPGSGTVWFGRSDYAQEVPAASAARLLLGDIEFTHPLPGEHSSLSPRHLTDARLLILRSRHAGRLLTDWSSPEYQLPGSRSDRSSRNTRLSDTDPWTSARFAAWFARLPKLTPEDDPALVEAHLRTLFEKLAHLDRTHSGLREPAVLYARQFVPLHLAFFLEQFHEVDYRVTVFLSHAIAIGATEDQKGVIIAELPTNHALHEVIQLRGWQDDAREVYEQLARNSQGRGSDFLETLLSYNDPSLDDTLLESFRLRPSPWLYERLRLIERLTPEVEKHAEELWRPGHIVLVRGEPLGEVRYGLIQGRPEALTELLAMVNLLHVQERNSSWQLARLVTESVQLPRDIKEHDYEKVLGWFSRQKADAFRFDPVLRRFIASPSNPHA